MRSSALKIGVVIPVFRERDHILAVVSRLPQCVSHIVIVDDACPENTGEFVVENIQDPRLTVMFNEGNTGVGGASLNGFRKCLELGCDLIVKLDGDGQHNPELIPLLVRPLEEGKAEYSKGNRFFYINDLDEMPCTRLLGNFILSFFSKLSSGYWGLFDPTNGLVCIRADMLRHIDMNKISMGFFFESDLLFRLRLAGATVAEVPMRAIYGDETSKLKISQLIFPFLGRHLTCIFKRLFYMYVLRGFSAASLMLILTVIWITCAIGISWFSWFSFLSEGLSTPTGYIFAAATSLIFSFQALLAFLVLDVIAGSAKSFVIAPAEMND